MLTGISKIQNYFSKGRVCNSYPKESCNDEDNAVEWDKTSYWYK